jgi:TRAP-type C4-dicarboxylate transport system permease small subunit
MAHPRIKGVSALIDKIVGVACGLLFGAMTIVVLVGVLFRYVFNAPLNWVEETSRYLMIWGASLAISIGISTGEHVGLTMILDALKPGTAKRALIVVINLLVLVFLVFMTYYATLATAESASQMTGSLGINMVLPKLAVPLSMVISAVQIVLTTIMRLSDSGPQKTGDEIAVF